MRMCHVVLTEGGSVTVFEDEQSAGTYRSSLLYPKSAGGYGLQVTQVRLVSTELWQNYEEYSNSKFEKDRRALLERLTPYEKRLLKLETL